jgi:hypothetical protein
MTPYWLTEVEREWRNRAEIEEVLGIPLDELRLQTARRERRRRRAGRLRA